MCRHTQLSAITVLACCVGPADADATAAAAAAATLKRCTKHQERPFFFHHHFSSFATLFLPCHRFFLNEDGRIKNYRLWKRRY
jgi:hypothetical protein